jgi:hypothetical protein
MEVFFAKDYKTYVELYGKKTKNEYVLNINKLIREKIGTEYLVPNKTQAFLLNYEIRKLVDKTISSKSKKYTRLVYLNCSMSVTGIMNAIEFFRSTYPQIEFNPLIIDTESEFAGLNIDAKIITTK